MKDQIIAKQKELIAHYEAKPLVGMRATKEATDWMDKKYDLIDELAALEAEQEECPNCGETGSNCACMRNICIKCGNPVGNITFTICDDCWGKLPKDGAEDSPKVEISAEEMVKENFNGLDELIKDKDILYFYKDLIKICLEEYASQRNRLPSEEENMK